MVGGCRYIVWGLGEACWIRKQLHALNNIMEGGLIVSE